MTTPFVYVCVCVCRRVSSGIKPRVCKNNNLHSHHSVRFFIVHTRHPQRNGNRGGGTSTTLPDLSSVSVKCGMLYKQQCPWHVQTKHRAELHTAAHSTGKRRRGAARVREARHILATRRSEE